MNLINRLQAKKKVTRHWLHCLISLFTFGAWLPFYIIILAFRAIHNRDIDSQIGGAALAIAEYRYDPAPADAMKQAQMRADFDDNLPLSR